jgi:hypothetical protein
MGPKELRQYAVLDDAGETLLGAAVRQIWSTNPLERLNADLAGQIPRKPPRLKRHRCCLIHRVGLRTLCMYPVGAHRVAFPFRNPDSPVQISSCRMRLSSGNDQGARSLERTPDSGLLDSDHSYQAKGEEGPL